MLGLADCKIEREGWEALVASPHIGGLGRLHVGSFDLERGLKWLDEALALNECGINRKGWKALVASPYFGGLKKLFIQTIVAPKGDVKFLRKALPDLEVT